jgi:hypothetical protein
VDTAGWSFWYNPGSADSVTASGATNLSGLDSYGWTTTALDAFVSGSGADFLSSADLDPTSILSNAAADLLASPRIFGSYDHGLQAAQFLGQLPTKLVVDLYGRFSTASAAESTTFMGLTGPAVVDAAAAGSGGAFRSNGTASTFRFTSDAAELVGANIDTNWHRWKATWDFSTQLVSASMDAAAMGTTIALEADIWPQSFVCFTGITNRWNLAWVNIRYER